MGDENGDNEDILLPSFVKIKCVFQNENVHQFFNLMPSQAHDFISSDELKDFYIKLLSF